VENNSTIIFPLPIDLLKPIISAQERQESEVNTGIKSDKDALNKDDFS